MDVYLGSLMLVPYSFAPVGFALCNGQLLNIASNTALFSLLGTQFGGNGTSNFGLPDLRGNVPVGMGQGPGLSSYPMGATAGAPTVTLDTTTVPPHTHNIFGSAIAATQPSPANNSLANAAIYANNLPPAAQLNPAVVSAAGSNQPHNNMMPYLTLNWIISLTGIFPPRS